MSMKEDLESRCLEIHWPEGFTPVDAGLFAHNEIVIQASSERVWQHIVAVTKWPAWYPNAKDVTILKGAAGVLEDCGVISWTTFGLRLKSRIIEFVPFRG